MFIKEYFVLFSYPIANFSWIVITFLIILFITLLIRLFPDFGNRITFGFFQIFTSTWVISPFLGTTIGDPMFITFSDSFFLALFSIPWNIFKSFVTLVSCQCFTFFFVFCLTILFTIGRANSLEFCFALSPNNNK